MSVPGQVIADRYRLDKLVGTGGMGVVWEAWDQRLQRRVAVKQLRLPDGLDQHETEVASQRAMREARITARLHHQNAISVFDVVDHEGRPCLIMQFVPSMTLADILKEIGPLQPHEASRLGAEVASALAAAHRLGIVHRDVKPSNVLVAEDGTALISDFGISQAMGDASLTATGLVNGTPSYLSPEVARGEPATFASDVFGLGATLYTALEGSAPFGTGPNSIAVLHRVAVGSFEPPQRSGPLTPVLYEMLATDPNARPPMDVAARMLEEAVGTPVQPSGVRGAGTPAVPMPTVPAQPPTDPAEVETPGQPAAPAAAVGTTAAGTAAAGALQTGAMSAAETSGHSRPPTGTDQPSADAASRRRRRAAWVGALVAALAVVGIGAALIIPSLGGSDDPGGAAGAPVTAGSTSSPSPDSKASSAAPSAEDTPTEQAPKPQPSSAERRPPGKDKSKADKTPTKKDLQNAITDYYALLPDDVDQAWPLMTDSYKANHAGGKRGYDSFWAPIEQVETQRLTATPPDRAEATVIYRYKSGRVAVERTSYQLVNDDGTLKIADSEVLSSSDR